MTEYNEKKKKIKNIILTESQNTKFEDYIKKIIEASIDIIIAKRIKDKIFPHFAPLEELKGAVQIIIKNQITKIIETHLEQSLKEKKIKIISTLNNYAIDKGK